MKVDVYKRGERAGSSAQLLYSYLIVPAGLALPSEVANTDWQVHSLNVDFDRDGKSHFTLDPADAFFQIGEKGYAITHLEDRVGQDVMPD